MWIVIMAPSLIENVYCLSCCGSCYYFPSCCSFRFHNHRHSWPPFFSSRTSLRLVSRKVCFIFFADSPCRNFVAHDLLLTDVCCKAIPHTRQIQIPTARLVFVFVETRSLCGTKTNTNHKKVVAIGWKIFSTNREGAICLFLFSTNRVDFQQIT